MQIVVDVHRFFGPELVLVLRRVHQLRPLPLPGMLSVVYETLEREHLATMIKKDVCILCDTIRQLRDSPPLAFQNALYKR